MRKRANTYTTTLHAINSCVVKLSKLTRATHVYRGLSDRTLPAAFWRKNEFGVMGGVEGGFLSTTLVRDVAFDYASRSTQTGILFQASRVTDVTASSSKRAV